MLFSVLPSICLLALDFDGVLTDNAVYVFEDGSEAVRCTRADGIGLSQIKKLGVHSYIISTETNVVVAQRAQKLKVPCVHGVEDKRAALDKILAELNLTPQQTAYIGNDVNDLPCLTYVGLPIVVADAHPAVLPHALYRTTAKGGYGAVREVCDLIAQALAA